jgi:hypothetical protein
VVPPLHKKKKDHKPNSLFTWLIRHQPAVLFSQNKSATSNQPTVLFSQHKSAPAKRTDGKAGSNRRTELARGA